MKLVRPVLGILLVALVGCATTDAKKKLVVDRAKFDLGCNGGIEVVELGGDSFGALGCDKKASYVVACDNSQASSCTAILNSDERPKDN